MIVKIRKFIEEDIPNKLAWINNPENNRYLHYELPLEYEKTLNWYKNNQGRTDRYDAVIEVDSKPVGLIGLLSINECKAEYYISMGETSYKGKGVAYKASLEIIKHGFWCLGLEKIYLYTEVDNMVAQQLFKKIGFKQKRVLKNDVLSHGVYVDRYYFEIEKDEFISSSSTTPVCYLGQHSKNIIYVKREDLIPYSFGGNKARKGKLFSEEIDGGNYDCVVTYGSSHSNHCRIIANMAAQRSMPCIIIGPDEVSEDTYNSKLMKLFEAEIISVPVKDVHDTIENKIAELKSKGKNPYFIPGGGHGNIGTQAYVDCYDEIKQYEIENNLKFDYIFFASGTGTTHAGLVCGQIKYNDDRKIIGISIARKNPRGRDVVIDSIKEYMQNVNIEEIEKKTIFIDEYTGDGYGKANKDITKTINEVMILYGIPLDSTYTGKAFYGMQQYIKANNVENKNILFIHTGGTPLFFDELDYEN